MYKLILRPLLFLFQPETIHNIIVHTLILFRYVPFSKQITRLFLRYKNPKLKREVFGLEFPNPVGLAAGFDKNASVYDMMGCMGFGFVEIGTVTPRAQSGNSKPRSFRLYKDKALVNRMGFNNLGVQQIIKNLRKRNDKLIIGGNIGKNTVTSNQKATEDYLKLFRALYDYVDYFTVNVSCPNVANLTQLQNKDNTVEILTALRQFRKGQTDYRPILLKISPDLNTEQLDVMIDVVKECKIDGIVAANTTISRENLVTNPKIVAKIANGGLSGAPLTNRTIEMVRYINNKTEGKFPIIAVGGVMTPQNAKDMLNAGASLVQIYTGFIYEGPCLAKRICKELAK